MTLESSVKTTADVVEKGTRLVETGIKKAWSILDSATEKKPPGEYLSKQAISAIQGKS
jgi:hypothetical protein